MRQVAEAGKGVKQSNAVHQNIDSKKTESQFR